MGAMRNSPYEMRPQGIMVDIFIILDWMQYNYHDSLQARLRELGLKEGKKPFSGVGSQAVKWSNKQLR